MPELTENTFAALHQCCRFVYKKELERWCSSLKTVVARTVRNRVSWFLSTTKIRLNFAKSRFSSYRGLNIALVEAFRVVKRENKVHQRFLHHILLRSMYSDIYFAKKIFLSTELENECH